MIQHTTALHREKLPERGMFCSQRQEILETVVDGVAVIAELHRTPWSSTARLLEPYRITGYVDEQQCRNPRESGAEDPCKESIHLVGAVYHSYRHLLDSLDNLRKAYRMISNDLESAREKIRTLEKTFPAQKRKVRELFRTGRISLEAYEEFLMAQREQKLQALNRKLSLEHAFVQTAARRFHYFTPDLILSLVESSRS